jgi:hypothetical protein
MGINKLGLLDQHQCSQHASRSGHLPDWEGAWCCSFEIGNRLNWARNRSLEYTFFILNDASVKPSFQALRGLNAVILQGIPRRRASACRA